MSELNAKAFDAAFAAYTAAMENPRLIECKRCKGTGSHHGFGEDGRDPDWCSVCGGGGFDAEDGEDTRPVKDAIRAYLRTTGEDSGGVAWHSMDSAPKDGREILVRRDNDCFHEHDVVWWSDRDAEYPWATHHGGDYPEGRLDEWMPLPLGGAS